MKTLALAGCLLLLCLPAMAIDLSGFAPIAPLAGFTTARDGITLTCRDGSEVAIRVLAPDLVRVRAAFGHALPARDHSWAIAKTDWDVPDWNLKEAPDALHLNAGELEVVVHRTPLLIEFRDAATHHAINADQRPMMFDPHSGAVAAAKKLGFDEHFYGLGEKAARLDKRRGQFSMWNSDTPAYVEGTDPIYQSIPFYLGWQDAAAYGIFFDNSFRTEFDFGRSSQEYAAFYADGGEMNYYFFYGPSIKKILGRYAELTGHMPMPPMWALGNQQCRWGYYPDTMAEEVVRRYRADDLPLDALYLDIDYMDGYRVFTWNPERFADPTALTDKLLRQGVKVVTIVDPGIKYDPGYTVFDQGLAKNYFLKRKDGSLFHGKVWPGDSVYVDYTLPEAARWWGDLHRAYTDHGVAGIWNDMNEPSDFLDQAGKTQTDVVSYDGGAKTTQAQNRNVFALNEARATYEGLERLRPNQRPYVITRAGYAGIQRYSTMWTGDNNATWDALALSIPMFETLGLSGEPFVGADAGGFMGRTNAELLSRWYQVAFLTPFCRNHADIAAYDHEPWRFGTFYEGIIRKYLKLRYRLLPFLYTALEEAHRTGVPLFRPLLLNYQDDPNTLNIDDEFMVGDALLEAPILRPGETARLVYLPAGIWYDHWTGQRYEGGRTIRAEAPLETVPLFVRGGVILPTGPEMNYVGERPSDPLRFEIYPDAEGRASGSLYEDDGATIAYRQGVVRRTEVAYRNAEVELSAPTGTFQPAPRRLVFSLHGRTVQITDDGRAHRVELR
ncbi:MAG: TIM-barrel domain-containing protein [Bryobacteraceae bacterium]|jgi:alpha-glucosidase